MLKDLRYAVRMLRNQPGFTLVAISSLAIGIGATSAIYSLADPLLLRPIAAWKPSQIVDIQPVRKGALAESTSLSYPTYVDLRDHNHTFNGLIATALVPVGLAPEKKVQPRMRLGMFVSGNFFETLRVEPSMGRGFAASEDVVPGRDAVVVLSHSVWASDFSSNPGVIGRKVLLNGIEFTVVGVAPRRFTGFGQIQPAMYLPLAMCARLWAPDQLTDRSKAWLDVRGRLKPGVSVAQAQADIGNTFEALRQSGMVEAGSPRLRVLTELQMRAERSPPDTALVVMLGLLAVCVLFIACGNVAGLLVARAAGRARELAVRLAMGASRSMLVRQLLLENLLLALGGGGVGLLVAWGATAFFNTLPIPTDMPFDLAVRIDARALWFTLIAALVSTFVFGLTPALRSTRLDLNSALKEKTGTASRRNRIWGRSIIVAGQVALSLTLLIVSAVLLEGFRSELGKGPGFRVDRLQLMSFDSSVVHKTDEQRDLFFKKLGERARLLPGVQSASLCSSVPLGMGGINSIGVIPDGYRLDKAEKSVETFDNVVTPEFFHVTGISILKGRSFSEADQATTPAVAIVNEQFARHYWPNQDAIGKRLRLRNASGKVVQIIGVARMAKYLWISEAPMDFIYLPWSQNSQSSMTLIAQSTGADPATLVPELRHLVQTLDPNIPMYDVRTMKSLFEDRAVATPRYVVKIVTGLGLLALILSCIGLYGIVSFAVSRRSREFGVRMAVGADRRRVARLVLGEALKLGMAGIAVGLLLGVTVSDILQAQMLFAFEHIGMLPYIAVCLLLLLTVCFAGYLPANRASRIDPIRALREE